jgi:hypothetical protein
VSGRQQTLHSAAHAAHSRQAVGRAALDNFFSVIVLENRFLMIFVHFLANFIQFFFYSTQQKFV